MFASQKERDEFQAIPKVELHRHLEGSLRLQTMIEIARKHGITIPISVPRFSRLVQVQNEDNLTFANFLSKFNTLRMFYRSPDVIERITHEAIEDAAHDNVRYLELRFAPVALSRAERFPLNDVMEWVCESTKAAAQKFGVTVRLIASVNRHESIELAEQVVWLSINRREKGIVAIDLTGNETDFPAKPFLPLFNEARQAGLKITMHAGEWGGPQNVREAIELFCADRIGHGVHVIDDPSTTALARERAIPFEVCLTSNYQTGATKALTEHPAPSMLDAGLNVTINTDDPSISQITLGSEYRVAIEDLKIPRAILKKCILAGAQAAFLPENDKKIMVDALKKELYK